jgi:RNA polymerase sigma-70 factor (ECF subfamily)
MSDRAPVPPPAHPKDASDAALIALIPRLTPLARRLGRDRAQADDLLQDTLTALLQRLRSGAEIDSLPAYGRMVLKNLARREGRSPKTEPFDEDALCDNGAAPDETAFATLEVLRRLPRAQARLLIAAMEGHSTAQMAAMEGVAPGTIHSRLARVRARLRADLETDTPGKKKGRLGSRPVESR